MPRAINSNSGTNQAEFFGGYAVGFSRVLVHGGLDYGRSQGLAPGFDTGALSPGFTGTSVPVVWKYHPQISIGFSVRLLRSENREAVDGGSERAG